MRPLPLIEIEHVTYGCEETADLEGVFLTIAPGDFILLIGPNGGINLRSSR